MKISKYQSATSIAEADTFVMVQSGETKKVTVAVLKQLLDIGDVFQYKGVIDCSTNPNYPAADAGHTYLVSVAGKIGGASGIVVAAGDMAICNTDGTVSGNQATVGTYWSIIEKNVDFGNVTITGGTIDGATIGGTTPAPGSFTEISANVIKTAASADATLSGTPIIITVYDTATNTPYYFKAYPVK